MFKPTVIDQFTDHVHTPLARWSDLHTHSRCASGFERLGFCLGFLCAAVSYFCCAHVLQVSIRMGLALMHVNHLLKSKRDIYMDMTPVIIPPFKVRLGC